MKPLQSLITELHAWEINHIRDLILKIDKPHLIILYGRFAGGELNHHLGGYDFLIVKDKLPEIYSSSVFQKLENEFPMKERIEKRIGIYFRTSKDITQNMYRDYFINTVRNDGIILYDDGSVVVPCKNKIRYGSIMKQVIKNCTTSLAMADTFLQDAQRYLLQGSTRMSAFNLSQSVTQYFRALEYSYYCNSTLYARINEHLRQISPVSEELYNYINGTKAIKTFFKHIGLFRFNSRFNSSFGYSQDYLIYCLQTVKNVGEIVHKEYNARVNYYKGKI